MAQRFGNMSNTISKDRIEKLAPDQASLGAALKLMKPASWPTLARDAEASLLWGECQGSGATPYRVMVSPEDTGYKCTCPSRKFPCKHVLAVMWLSCDKPERFEQGPPPDWVQDWLSRRRPKSGGAPPAAPDETAARKTAPSMAEALAETAAAEEKTADPKAMARAEAQRQRLRDERENAVRDGLDDLDRWIVDQLHLGVAGFAKRGADSIRTLSARLVDAKAQGLAGRLDALAAEMFRIPEQIRSDVVLERFTALALISAAYRNQDRLPQALKADVRRVTGWSVKREELLSDTEAPRVASGWIVATTRSEMQPDKLRRLETWLVNASPVAGAPKFALLVDFVPVSAGPSGPSFVPGETFDGEVVFYRSAAPLRAQVATRLPAKASHAWPEVASGLDAALNEFETTLARQPWLDLWPLAARGLHVRRLTPHLLALADDSGLTLPIGPVTPDGLLPMLGLSDIAAWFTWDGRFANVLAAATPIGNWHEARP